MIVIKATGTRDAGTVRRLAESLRADEVSVEDIAPVEEVRPDRRRRGPRISVLPGATIAPATQAALLELSPSATPIRGEYEHG